MKITSKIKDSWLELCIEDGNTIIDADFWAAEHELSELKEQLEEVISDINYMIEKVNKAKTKQ